MLSNSTYDLGASWEDVHVISGPRYGRDVGENMFSERITQLCPDLPTHDDRPFPIENSKWHGYACVRQDGNATFQERMEGQSRARGRPSTESIEIEAMTRAHRMSEAEHRRRFEASAGHSL